MRVTVATSGYGTIDLSKVFTVLANTYLDNGKQISFSSSGIVDWSSGYIGKFLFEDITQKLYIGGSGSWISIPNSTYVNNISGSLQSGYIAADLALSGTLTTSIASASGTLNTKIDNVSGALYNQIWASGSIVTAIDTASGAAVTNAVGQAQTIITNASGVLNTKIDNTSGTLNNKIWASGSIVTAIANASGAAVTNAVGQSTTIINNASGVLNTKIDNTSGTLNSKIWASGSIVTAIANASGAAVITASGIANNTYLKKDGSTPLTGNWDTGNSYRINAGQSTAFGFQACDYNAAGAGTWSPVMSWTHTHASETELELKMDFNTRTGMNGRLECHILTSFITDTYYSKFQLYDFDQNYKTEASGSFALTVVSGYPGSSTQKFYTIFMKNPGNFSDGYYNPTFLNYRNVSGVTYYNNTTVGSGTLAAALSGICSRTASGIFYPHYANAKFKDTVNTGNLGVSGVINSIGGITVGNLPLVETLTVSGSASYAKKHYLHADYSVPASTYVQINTREGISNLVVGYAYRVSLATTGTSTDTGAVYIVNQRSSAPTWEVKLVSQGGSGASTRHPLMRLNGTALEIYHNYASTSNISVYVEAIYVGNTTIVNPTFFGLDGGMTNDNGKIGIANTTPITVLDVSGVITASGGNSTLWNAAASSSGLFVKRDGTTPLTANWSAEKSITCNNITASGGFIYASGADLGAGIRRATIGVDAANVILINNSAAPGMYFQMGSSGYYAVPGVFAPAHNNSDLGRVGGGYKPFNKIVASGGFYFNSTKVVGAQQAAIADLNPAVGDYDARVAINSILAVMRSHGLIAT